MNTILPARDFPLWIPPALVKELRQCMRTPAFMNMLILVPCSLSVIFLLSLLHTPDGDTIISQSSTGGWFWGLLILSLALLVPNWALGSMRVDIEEKSRDLLILTRLTPRRTAWEKWVAYMALAGLILCTLLPFAIIRYFGGQVSLTGDLFLLFCIYLTCAILTAGAIWISGMPIVLRVLFSMGTGIIAVLGIVACIFPDEITSFMDTVEIPMALGIMLVDSAFVVTAFLLLAARWLSPPSANMVPLFRMLAVLALIPTLILSLTPAWDNLLKMQMIFLIILSTLIVLIELTLPATLLPIHVVEASQKRFSWIRKILFLPGLPSASAFTFLLIFLSSAIIFISFRESIENDIPLIMWPFMALFFWYSVMVPALILYPFQKKLGTATPIIYIVIAYIFAGIYGIFVMMKMETIASFIPAGSVVFALKNINTNSLKENMMLICASVITAGITLIWLKRTARSWFKVRKEGLLLAAARKKGQKEDSSSSS